MATNYTTRTAALKATKADINKLDAKKMLLNGKNILDYISESEFNSYDTRDPQLKNDELDIWNTEISLSEEGHIEVKPLEHTIIMDQETFVYTYSGLTENQHNTLKTATKIIDNEVLGENDEHIMYWQTDGLTDGITMFARCFNLTSFTSDLSSLTNGQGMFEYCTALTTFSSDLPSLTDGAWMFSSCDNLISFTSDLSSLTNGQGMFYYCYDLESFNSDLSSLTDGSSMFYYSGIESFTSDLSSLTNGTNMFNYCSELKSFSSNLSSLENASLMFINCSKLTTFTSDLPSLTDGGAMFGNCFNLASFSSDLSNLTNGNTMFRSCSNLTSFSSGLSSLTNGTNMFSSCKLDAQSVANIIHFIPQRDAKPTSTTDDGNILIGIGITNTDAAKQAFAEECYCNNWDELNQDFDDKNWAVQWQFNGEAATYDLRSPRPSTAVYAKLEEVFIPTDEEIVEAKVKRERIEIPHYQYTSQDGTKFYNIYWYHDSNSSNEGFMQFESLEHAIEAFEVIPVEN